MKNVKAMNGPRFQHYWIYILGKNCFIDLFYALLRIDNYLHLFIPTNKLVMYVDHQTTANLIKYLLICPN